MVDIPCMPGPCLAVITPLAANQNPHACLDAQHTGSQASLYALIC